MLPELLPIMEKMQKKAFNSIKENLKIFLNNLDIIEEKKDCIKLGGKGDVEDVVIKQKTVKKLLGRIYLAVIEATVKSRARGRATLHVEGILSKKGVKFRGEGEIPEILNKESEILSILSSIDMEEVSVWAENKRVRISIIPYSSSYVWMFLPPMSYNVKLSQKEAEDLFKLVFSMSRALSRF